MDITRREDFDKAMQLGKAISQGNQRRAYFLQSDGRAYSYSAVLDSDTLYNHLRFCSAHPGLNRPVSFNLNFTEGLVCNFTGRTIPHERGED